MSYINITNQSIFIIVSWTHVETKGENKEMMLTLKKVENVIQNVFNEDQDPMK